MSTINPICPQGCSSILPEISFDLCNPNVTFGEIQRIFIGMADATPFASGNWTDPTLWEDALSRGALEQNALRQLYVSADLPFASADESVISLGRKIYSSASHVINVDIDDLSQENYDFARSLSCNLQFRVWFFTNDYMFGGQDGLLVMFNLRPIIERGIKSLNKLTGTITWEDKFSAERDISIYSSIVIPVSPTETIPTLLSAYAPDGGSIYLVFDVAMMSNPSAFASDVTVGINAAPVAVSAIYIYGIDTKILIVDSSSLMVGGDVLTISIVSGNITSADGGILATVTDFPVQNLI